MLLVGCLLVHHASVRVEGVAEGNGGFPSCVLSVFLLGLMHVMVLVVLLVVLGQSSGDSVVRDQDGLLEERGQVQRVLE